MFVVCQITVSVSMTVYFRRHFTVIGISSPAVVIYQSSYKSKLFIGVNEFKCIKWSIGHLSCILPSVILSGVCSNTNVCPKYIW